MKPKTIALLLAAFFVTPSLWAQDEIEIIDENGERVGNHQIEIQIENTDGDAAAVASAKIEGDKIIIIDKDGNTQEIDISDAKGVSVQQSVQTVNNNGEQKTVRKSKAVITKPNGDRQVIELDGPIDGGEMAMPNMPEIHVEMLDNFGEMPMGLRIFGHDGLPGSLKTFRGNPSKYMIGVHCEPVGDQLRAHLDLTDDVGLIVKSVSPGSPSESGGIHKHDILIVAEDKELTDVEVLSSVIDLVGEEGNEISITAIRNGKEVSFSFKPVERPAGGQMEMVMPRFQFQRLGPGIIAEPGGDFGDMRQQMERMQQQFDEMKQLMDQRRQQMMQNSDQNLDNGNNE